MRGDMSEEQWKEETDGYFRRLVELGDAFNGPTELARRLPDLPIDYQPSPEGSVALRLALYVLTGSTIIVAEALTGAIVLWGVAKFALVSLPARLAYEEWAAACYARQTLERMLDGGDVAAASRRTDKLVLGARYDDVKMPWGEKKTETSVHINDMIEVLEAEKTGRSDTYDFLCESCHPSFMQLTYWILASPDDSSWSNTRFKEHMHNLMARTIGSLEQSVGGTVAECERVIELADPLIEKDRIAA